MAADEGRAELRDSRRTRRQIGLRDELGGGSEGGIGRLTELRSDQLTPDRPDGDPARRAAPPTHRQKTGKL